MATYTANDVYQDAVKMKAGKHFMLLRSVLDGTVDKGLLKYWQEDDPDLQEQLRVGGLNLCN